MSLVNNSHSKRSVEVLLQKWFFLLLTSRLNCREGIVTNKPAKETKGSYVNIGLLNDCLVDKTLNAGLRVTVKMDASQGNEFQILLD